MRSRQRNIFEKHGNIFFVTSTIVGFINLFFEKPLCDIFIENLAYYQSRGDYKILAFVLMPNHFHLVPKISPGHTISKCIGNLKRITSRKITDFLYNHDNRYIINQLVEASKNEGKGQYRVWESRFDSFVINNVDTLRQKVKYIYDNPVRKNLVTDPFEWPYSSARNYEKADSGIIDIETDWQDLIK